MGRKGVALSLVLVLIAGCARGHAAREKSAPDNIRASETNAREEELGRQIHQSIISSFRVYTEPRLVGYVSRVGRALSKKALRRDLIYRFTVLYDDRVYATSAPGGFVYITTGFLNFLQNEPELAAVLAHEIAQLQNRDVQITRARKAMTLVTQGGAIAAPFLGPIGSLAAGGLVLLNAFVESRVGTPEGRIRKADRDALHYMTAAGEDPQGYLDVLGRILNPSPEWSAYLYDYSSSHPLDIKRFQKVMGDFEKLSLEGKNFDVHRARYLELTKGVREIYQR